MPRSWSLRLCALTALNMGMLLSCGFNSTLTSYLAFRAPYVGMSNLDDVWRLGTYSLCVRNKSLAYDELTGAITTGNKPTATKEKWAKLLNKNCPDMENELELRKNLCRAGFVYVEASDVFLKEYRHVQDICQIVKIPGTYWSSKISLMRLRSSGILKYLEAKWSFQQNLQHGVFNNFQPVELGHIQVLLVGLIIMMIFSVIICIFENLWFSYCNKTRKLTPYFLRNEISHLYNPIHEKLVIEQPNTKIKRLKSSINKRTSNQIMKHLSLHESMKNMNK
ncbi:hypothetical protein TSAR_004765 [Trichomalopsis sarcophagae]|uniref:Uncharacterized protein n=1 Tax=Trichomalopsis sarcophagae TaxID=543379 RepID=A0A232ENZ9_9HYME|nr:hypothetical protein TSAR_004765 [Trichomalopsis sarcophagae]